MQIKATITNTGDRYGEEVVQLYVSVPDLDGIQPRWSLKNFTRVELRSGSSTEVSFRLDSQALEQINQEGVAEVVPGEYWVYVGNGSPGERSEALGVQMLSATFHVKDGI